MDGKNWVGVERRTELRLPTAGRVCWRRLDNSVKFVGWLSDASPLSVSFVTSAASQPSFGEELELLKEGEPLRRCRVTRMAPYDDHFSLVACRVIPENEVEPVGILPTTIFKRRRSQSLLGEDATSGYFVT